MKFFIPTTAAPLLFISSALAASIADESLHIIDKRYCAEICETDDDCCTGMTCSEATNQGQGGQGYPLAGSDSTSKLCTSSSSDTDQLEQHHKSEGKGRKDKFKDKSKDKSNDSSSSSATPTNTTDDGSETGGSGRSKV